MDPTERTLLAAIRESPDDMLTRQALGDWMLERDDPLEQALGELIQVQCRMHGLPEWSVERMDLGIRERELLNRHRWDWGRRFFPGIGGIEQWLRVGGVRRGQFHLTLGDERFNDWPAACRGYHWVEGVTRDSHARGLAESPLAGSLRELDTSTFLDPREGPSPLASEAFDDKFPCLDSLTLSSSVPADALGLGPTQLASHLRHLSIHIPLEPEAFQVEWPRLESLHLDRCLRNAPALAAICRLELPALRSFWIWQGDHCLDMIAAAPWAKRVKHLTALGSMISPDIASFASLERLDLTGVLLDDGWIERLARCGILARLRSLSLASGGSARYLHFPPVAGLAALEQLSILDIGMESTIFDALAASPLLSSVNALSLSCLRCGRQNAAGLAQSPHASSITRLHIGRCPTLGGLEAIELLPLPALRVLELPDCAFDPTTFGTFLERPEVSKLMRLDLSRNRIWDEGLSRLASCGNLAGLRELDVSHCEITDAGIQAFARTSRLTGLRRLRIQGWFRKHSTAVALAKSDVLSGLVELNLERSRIGRRGKALLRERFGDALVI